MYLLMLYLLAAFDKTPCVHESVVGRNVGSNSKQDTSTYRRAILSPTQTYTIQESGIISAFVVPRLVNQNRYDVMPIEFQVWRQQSGNTYKLMARTGYINVTNQESLRVTLPVAEPIEVEEGDVIGFQINGAIPIPFVQTRCNTEDRIR